MEESMKDILESMLNQICGANLFSSIYETLSVNLFSSGGAFGTAYNVVHAIYNTIMSIGVMLLFVYFIVALVDKLSSDTFTWETLWRQFALLLAAKYIMENGFQLLEIIFNIGMATAAKVSALGDPSVSETAIDAAAVIDNFTASFTGIFSALGHLIMMLYLLIPWLLSWIMGLCVSIICYSRVIEIYVRATFAPIALSDFFHSGLHGSGWRYLKSFLAVALQGALILVIGMIYSALFKGLTLDTEASLLPSKLLIFLGKFIILYASAVMLMFKSLPLAKELVGVS